MCEQLAQSHYVIVERPETHDLLSLPLHHHATRAVPNILFVFYSGRIVGRIVYLYSAE